MPHPRFSPPLRLQEIVGLSTAYEKAVKQEIELSAEQLVVATVGKVATPHARDAARTRRCTHATLHARDLSRLRPC
eukprot:3859432-Pleurochrysis_carterae.AAC.7